MPVKLFSGLPGAGKTAQMVAEMVRRQEQEPERPLFYMGINGLVPGIATELTQEQLEHWWELPPDSVICLDECQEDHLMPTDMGKPKDWVKRIRKVRHEGMDFLLTCQHPADVSTSVRRLVDQHVHTVRKFNSKIIQKFTWGRCMNQPENERVQRGGIEGIGTLPSKIFDLYVSSQSHNMKLRIPRKVWLLGALAALAVAAVIGVPFAFRHLRKTASAGVVPVSAASGGPAVAVRGEDLGLRVTDYAKWVEPRVAGLPWTAPAYDGQQVTAKPRVFCIAVETGDTYCVTEQGTKYDVPAATARLIAASGVYNPFYNPSDYSGVDKERRGAPPPSHSAERGAAGDAAPRLSYSGDSSGYKSGVAGQSYVPPELTTAE